MSEFSRLTHCYETKLKRMHDHAEEASAENFRAVHAEEVAKN